MRDKGSHYNVVFKSSAQSPSRSAPKNHRGTSSVPFLKEQSEFSFQKLPKMLWCSSGAGFGMGRRRKITVANKRATA